MTEHVICDRCEEPVPAIELCACPFCKWDGICILCVALDDNECEESHGSDGLE